MPGADARRGRVLLRTIWLSLDPYMRGRMSDGPSYAQPVPIDGVMEGGTVSEVIASNNPGFRQGRHRAVARRLADACDLRRQGTCQDRSEDRADLDRGRRARHARHDRLHGLLDIGKPQAGETVVVAAASGAVGSAVGQISRSRAHARSASPAARTNATTSRKSSALTIASITATLTSRQAEGSLPERDRRLFRKRRRRGVRGGIPLLNAFARIPVCGLIAHYNDTEATAPKWAGAMMRNVLTKRLTIRGFIVSDFAARHGDFLRDMSGWVREGKVKHKEFVTEGLDSAPAAFMGLLKGANFGKQLVRVGPDKA
jgi:NADPH-dependent curcumin reductase CurA